MKVVRSILFVLVIAGVVQSARADMCPGVLATYPCDDPLAPCVFPQLTAAPSTSPTTTDPPFRLDGYREQTGNLKPLSGTTLSMTDEAATDGTEKVWNVPALPSSSNLCLSGLLSVGALHLARRVKHIQFGHVPDWFHSACPDRIGHAVSFDFNLADMPVCFVAQAAADTGSHAPVARKYLCDSHSRMRFQFVPLVTGPRGPPLCIN